MININRILMATDFSDYSRQAMDYAIYLNRKLGADLFLMHVFEPLFYAHAGVSPGIQHEVRGWIDKLKQKEKETLEGEARKVRNRSVKVQTIFREGKPYVEIIKAIKELDMELVVLGTHGRSGLAHILMGSVAERVLKQSPCPVFTVRPKKVAAGKPPK